MFPTGKEKFERKQARCEAWTCFLFMSVLIPFIPVLNHPLFHKVQECSHVAT